MTVTDNEVKMNSDISGITILQVKVIRVINRKKIRWNTKKVSVTKQRKSV